jgi:glutamate dehydrogenase
MSSGSSVEDQPLSIEGHEGFLGDYYEHLAEEDARGYPGDVLAARAEKHRSLASIRKPGQAKISISDEEDSSVVFVVTDDMPFLVDSVNAELVRQHAAIRLVVHPLFVAARNRETGALVTVNKVPSHIGISSGDTAAMPSLSHLIAQGENASYMESWIAVEINRVSDEAKASLLEGLQRVLNDVRAAVEDWPKMRQKALEIAENLDRVANPAQIAELRQAKDLLHWLDDGNFTFLGYREYDLVNVDGEDVLELREDSGLGLLRAAADSPHIQHLTDTGRKKAREKRALVITKANSRSTVHRSAYLDYIGVKSFDAAGNVNGEQRFIGLFATSAYTGSVRNIPIVREKVDAVLNSAGFPPDSHSGKDLLGILETYPRDELFQIEVPDLAATALGIQKLQERRRTRLFLRPDIYGRFMSAVVYLPRDRYTTNVSPGSSSASACPRAPTSAMSTPRNWKSAWCLPPAPGARVSPTSCVKAGMSPAPRSWQPSGLKPSRRATGWIMKLRTPLRTSRASKNTVQPQNGRQVQSRNAPACTSTFPKGRGQRWRRMPGSSSTCWSRRA